MTSNATPPVSDTALRDKIADILAELHDYHGMDVVEAADAIIAALPDMIEAGIPDLVWGEAHDNGTCGLCIVAYGKPYMGRFNIEWWSGRALLMVAGGEWIEYLTKEAAKAAANAHHRAQIMAAMMQGVE